MFTNRIALCLAIIAGIALMNVSAGAADGGGGMKLRFALAGPDADTSYTVTVSGKVLDKSTGQVIPGAKVRGHIIVYRFKNLGSDWFSRCPYQETTANGAGEYCLKFVTPLSVSGQRKGQDNFCVDAGAPGHETRPVYAEKYITPKRTDYPNFDIALEKGKPVQGTVRDENNQPVAGAHVSIHSGLNGDWSFFHSLGDVTTGQDGKFQLNCGTDENLVANNPWIAIDKPGYGVGFYFDILKKEDMGTLVLPRGGELRGKVLDSEGKGVGNCEVLCNWWSNWWRTRTDAEGNYTIVGVPGEDTIKGFTQKKNGTYNKIWAIMDVYARPTPAQHLCDAPTCQIVAQKSQTVIVPDLVIGNSASVAGRLIPGRSTPALKGLLVRLDYDWARMVEADSEGRFYFPSVPTGKHRLTAYLPFNLRSDRGIGRVEIDVKPRQKIEDVKIQLESLAEVRVQILDASGNPLEGITASASWDRNESGGWTEGTRSGADGWAVLYLYPGESQYVRGYDEDHALVSDGFVEVSPKPGEVINKVRVTMVKPAAIAGRLTSEGNAPLAGKKLLCAVNYADGSVRKEDLKIDGQGRFEMKNLTPGAVKLAFSSSPTEFSGSMDTVTEIKPGEAKDFGEIALKLVRFHLVKGRLSASPTFQNLESFKIRLDLEEWQPMVPTDAQGNFALDKVPAGKHLLIAYLPYNARTDRGVGHVKIEVKDGDLQDIVLPLETLATIHMRIQNEKGELLEGVSAAAWWTADHSGVFTEGSRSGKDGRATLYLYPDSEQYIGAHDWEGRYTLTADARMTLKPGEEVKDYVVVMR